MIDFIRDLKAIVAAYRKARNEKRDTLFTILLKWKDGRIQEMQSAMIYDSLKLPRVIAKPITDGELPSVTEMVVFELKHYSRESRVGLYQERE